MAGSSSSEVSIFQVIHAALELTIIDHFSHVDIVHFLRAVDLHLQDCVQVIGHIIDILRQLVKLEVALAGAPGHLHFVRIVVLLPVNTLVELAGVHVT